MMAKDNFDFDTESKSKFSLDFSFFKNLTQKQKETILMIAIAVVAVIVIVVIGVLVMTGGSGNGNNGGTGTNAGNGDNNVTDENDKETDNSEDNNIINGEITSFYISSTPNKTVYYVGDTVDYTGLCIFLRSAYGGGKYIDYIENQEDFTISGFDSSVANKSVIITVEYAGVTDTFTIEVVEKEVSVASLVGITIDPPIITTYKVGESLDTTGGYIVCEYSDGTTEQVELTMKHIFGYGAIANTPGEHQIKVKYADGKGGYAETTFTITITE